MDETDDMAWAEFSAEHDHRRADGSVVAYLPGMLCSVHRACLVEAVARGAAVEAPTPSAEDAERLKADPYWRPRQRDAEA